jgi:DNA-binding transcriptional ArsR family regulator
MLPDTTLIAPRPAASLLLAKFFRGFADPSRLAILESLRRGPRSVGQIVTTTMLSQSNVSNHLACLHDCGLVAREPRGRHVFYRLSDPRVGQLLGMADELLADVAVGVDACTRYGDPGGT